MNTQCHRTNLKLAVHIQKLCILEQQTTVDELVKKK